MKRVWRLGSRKSRGILWFSEPYYFHKKIYRPTLLYKTQCKYCMFQTGTGSHCSFWAGLCEMAEACEDLNCQLLRSCRPQHKKRVLLYVLLFKKTHFLCLTWNLTLVGQLTNSEADFILFLYWNRFIRYFTVFIQSDLSGCIKLCFPRHTDYRFQPKFTASELQSPHALFRNNIIWFPFCFHFSLSLWYITYTTAIHILKC
jgi:hypothetical protein